MNVHESAARTAKALRLVDGFMALLNRAGERLAEATGEPATPLSARVVFFAAHEASEDVWQQVAVENGINPPSQATIAAAIKVLEYAAQQAKADPFAGLA